MTIALNRSTNIKLIIITIVAAIVTGCASFSRDFDSSADQEPVQSIAFENARSLYDQGNYEIALEQFKSLSTTDTPEEIALNAKLGGICCRLMLAITPADYYTSLGMWNEFAGSISGAESFLDFDMIDPVIVRLTTELVKQNMEIYRSKISKQKISEAPQKPKVEDQEVKAQLSILKKKVKKTVKKKDQLQRQLEEMEAENRSLNEKIKALEAIDQSIQKKKSEIALPGES